MGDINKIIKQGGDEVTEKVKQIINDWDNVADEIIKLDMYSFTPLHYAAMYGHTDICAILIELGVLVNWQGLWGNTALHHAALWGHVSVCRLLVEKGAQVHIKNRDGQTALDCAIMMSKKDGKPSEFTQIIDMLSKLVDSTLC